MENHAIRERPPKKDMTHAHAASQRTFARRRAIKAVAELEKQGLTVRLFRNGTEVRL